MEKTTQSEGFFVLLQAPTEDMGRKYGSIIENCSINLYQSLRRCLNHGIHEMERDLWRAEWLADHNKEENHSSMLLKATHMQDDQELANYLRSLSENELINLWFELQDWCNNLGLEYDYAIFDCVNEVWLTPHTFDKGYFS
ncbi:hypothetical protein BKH46_06005 [Helicobacter sp. 12S02634-8]|uniref:hypothetical protein n=1 Tax=Helicobacter sp. 12S02634-8 TaxID=1476199 RepID=UPI000BA5B7AC|nr:hypothetical protein [Helicobacter sp. 12S02634-8]PAF46773.1 hypothetical protein BKH46_06005 [Helicobacter sp. 12S02634-8]